ncbi:unnamed protein product [Clonostachys rhizophaga]|uniref:Carboxylesterase family protein n=1 Tax=Clonostachys rhizophaga TaxID=160324 RepID=A0A9N9VRD2_9HYPO|nr:unnamed protein product [Clonostachys rhizophaga]
MLGHTYLPPPQRADSLDLLALDAVGLQDSFDLAAGANCEPLGALSKTARGDLDFAKPLASGANATSRAKQQRLSVQLDTFESTEGQEESRVVDIVRKSQIATPGAVITNPSRNISSCGTNHQANHILANAYEDCSIKEQVQNQLAGQFEWLIIRPAPATSAGHHVSHTTSESESDISSGSNGKMVFGCNLLFRKRRSASRKAGVGCPLANSYTFIATPLGVDASIVLQNEGPEGRNIMAAMSNDTQGTYLDAYQKPTSTIDVMEQAVSPSLTVFSERSGSFADGSSRAGSFSLPRIEDSLAELDQLEDELEAVTAIANSKSGGSSDRGKSQPTQEPVIDTKKDKARKRVTLAIPQGAATVRAKSSEKIRPALRRSSSLTLRSRPTEEQKVLVSVQNEASQPRTSVAPRSSGSKPMVTSTKPLTVPNFELPGEAVARRLKEQREARRAQQQSTAPKAYVAPPRPKSDKPLTKPSFELPGEAISRRKREEREARLKAQEEEDRKKREFKARPVRQSTGPIPTIRAQKPKAAISSDLSQKPPADTTSKVKQTSAGPVNFSSAALTIGKAAGRRGRVSFIEPPDDASRGTSESARSTSGKRSSVSVEEVVNQRARGKEILIQDNSFKINREREKREREEAAKSARQQAAERSRAASREWAEKKRRKEEALLRKAAQSSEERKGSSA